MQNCEDPDLSLDWYISGFYYVGAADLFLPEARKMLSEILNVLLRTANA